MQQRTKSFLSKITRTEVMFIITALLLVPVIRGFYTVLMMSPLLPGTFGVFCPVVMNCIGSAIGISTISKSTSGGSVRSPALVMKSLLGIVLCEANLIFSILNFFFLKEKSLEISREKELTLRSLQASWGILASGLVCGICGMVSSFGSAVVNSSSSISIASNSKMFSKLVSLQLIVGGVGIFGTIVSLFFLRLPIVETRK
ncbi:V-type H+-transporting ATPase 21kDa proteolipid subunit [Nematocida major]|uniref:V-type H+-transporting ATPase 21kDa proteolipid subunit n=1 Tax=Nematocida major TaxID=1912982 RepID=UPI002008460E|nr:V-type H+-transporting ATPase 21kDa proteolipid subunit [Nematocida major]KAH9385937.1 V-type H+-transporting ATPase 21kDa proteolipid subunit [Nematocida major]